ncbi:MAG: sigma-54-dependent Fis family transcriptional regulator [Bacteroidetes bacterium]|nr:sigma-54-dependent Fis family transcriptional regulator [Bacteroidota bacterium]
MEIQAIKQRFNIIGNSPLLERAIDVARQVAPTDISVLVSGESGVGKEVFPKIIHQLSPRKHGQYIAVNCGAIPEGTIDSELFGHEKGSFTGAHEARRGYFEVVDGGTIFLDEVSELPLLTQVRLLRILESGEFIRVGSSKIQKTNVRVVAATNVNLQSAIASGKFREDLYYRLNTVPIQVPALRERKGDIILLFRKFASDFAERYRMPVMQLSSEAEQMLINYRWPGNVRQLKNLAEQISVIENERMISGDTLHKYLPQSFDTNLPVLFKDANAPENFSERELLYKVLFDMKKDVNDMKKIIMELIHSGEVDQAFKDENKHLINKLYRDTLHDNEIINTPEIKVRQPEQKKEEVEIIESYEEAPHVYIEETLSIQEKEKDLIIKALEKYRGRRKKAADELGISERTLYRKIKEYGVES